jgi:hypothetical protein
MVVAVDRSKGRNVYVTINAEHLQEEVKAWADTHSGDLAAALDAAYAGGQRVAYVIDVHRTRNVDPAIPFAELGKRQKVRDLTGLTPVDGAGNPLAGGAPPPTSSTPPATLEDRAAEAAARADGRHEDPPTLTGTSADRYRGESYRETEARAAAERAARQPARGPHAPCPRCGHPLGTVALRRGDAGMEHVECPAGDPDAIDHETAAADAEALEQATAGTDGPDTASDATTAHEEPASAEPRQPSPPAPRSPRRGRIEEARPWEFYGTDGRINLGSYAVTAAVGMVELAARLIVEHNRVTSAATGRPVEAPTRGQVLGLARYLLEASDAVQATARPDGKADRMDNSHTRARGAVRSALDLYPVPFGASEDDRAAWLEDLVAFASILLEVSVTLTEVAP